MAWNEREIPSFRTEIEQLKADVTRLNSKLQVIKRANLLAAAVWKDKDEVDDLSDRDDTILISTFNEIAKQLEDVKTE